MERDTYCSFLKCLFSTPVWFSLRAKSESSNTAVRKSNLDPLDSDPLLFKCQEPGSGRRIREEEPT
jgi:hypothetical protein